MGAFLQCPIITKTSYVQLDANSVLAEKLAGILMASKSFNLNPDLKQIKTRLAFL